MSEGRNLDRTWLCSTLFADIVKYSSQSTEQQVKWKSFFNGVLAEALKPVPGDDRVVLDTGDGAAICFLGDPEVALVSGLAMRSAFVMRAAEDSPAAQVRLGIHLGPVKLVRDINGNLNALGDGINVAQRIMSFAEPNQVLVSRSYFDVMSRLSDDYSRLFRCVGVRQDKHVREYTVYELASGSEAASEPSVPTFEIAPPPPAEASPAEAAPVASSRAAPAPSPEPVAPKRSVAPLAAVAAVLALALAAGGYWFIRKTPDAGVNAPAELPLVRAIEQARLDDARNLLAKRVDVNAAKADGTTALMRAAEGTGRLVIDTEAVKLLLDHNAQVDARDKRGRTALYRAAIGGRDEAIRLLLARKANPNHRADDGNTPLLMAVVMGKLGAAKLLLDSGAHVDLANAQSGETPLMRAAEGPGAMPNNAPLVEAVLAKNPALEAQDRRGRTALLRAAASGKADAIRLLLEKGAKPNAQANDGSTPLSVAVMFGRMPAAELLLERGAHVDLADASGTTPLMIAAEGTGQLQNNAPAVASLLAAGAKVDLQDSRGRGALYRAAAAGRDEAIRLLLDKKANPNLKASDGSTPLVQAVRFGKRGAVELLLGRGANPNEADGNGTTPLMIAAEGNAHIKRNDEYVSLLLAHDAKPDLTDRRGRTALARAERANNAAAIEALSKRR
ncbi:MAG: ankyrin repeat domain-containing protein [Bryobacteraceae bacterium]|nr:ankyrin repeat domain-containing protein [Bryobacteraceae bacterium]